MTNCDTVSRAGFTGLGRDNKVRHSLILHGLLGLIPS